MESFTGRISSIIHKSDDYYILSVEPSNPFEYSRKVTTKGRVFGIREVSPGVTLEFRGRWVTHPKFGRQFDLSGWAPWAETETAVENFLICLGVPEVQANLIVSRLGVKTFEVFENDSGRLRDVPGLDEATMEQVLSLWDSAQTSADLSSFFADHDVSSQQMSALFEGFGSQARTIVEENPYRLLEIEGWPFAKVDEVAERLGVAREDPRRFEGAALWVLREESRNGHLCVRRGDIPTRLLELIRAADVDPFDDVDLSGEMARAIERLAVRGSVHVNPNRGVYLFSNYFFEHESAQHLARFLTPLQIDVDLPEFISTYETIQQIQLSTAQKEGLEKILTNKVLVLTGLPGTGKTTVIKTIVGLFERAGISFSLMAPTGIAAKRLATVTNHRAATIHRTLRYDGQVWGFDRHNRYPIGAVIVDEMSMVDQELFYRVLDALEESTILILVGDDAQLPSVGPGNVLRELIRCSKVATVRLTQIFRQAEASDIILNSHRINAGENIKPGSDTSDFRFVSVADEDRIAQLVIQMAIKLKGRDANFQILSPKYEGVVGVNNLNDRLREVLNPPGAGKREWTAGPLKFREGDRVMVIRNDYNLGVYNGDMGKIISVYSDRFVVRVHGAGEDGLDTHVTFKTNEIVQKLRLAYAITVHKSQGSEFDTVILPMVKSQGRMLQRNLFYTAVTRAKQKVWILGDSTALTRAINNDRVVLRNTGFSDAISRAIEGLVLEQGSTPALLEAPPAL